MKPKWMACSKVFAARAGSLELGFPALREKLNSEVLGRQRQEDSLQLSGQSG